MTQDATTQTPLQALQSTLSVKLGVPPPIGNAFVAPGCEQFTTDRMHSEGPIKIEDHLGAGSGRMTGRITMGADGTLSDVKITWHEKLDHLEAEGAALLQTVETHIEDAGHTIVEIGNHALHPRTPAPHHIDMARALPLARAGDILHESEHAVIRAFLDVGDVLRRVYLNVHGLWVKA